MLEIMVAIAVVLLITITFEISVILDMLREYFE